jgi:RHS repeat-associated protein
MKIGMFFDNLQVTHVRGPLVEETHYYPFGLTMAGISSKALNFGSPQNRKKFNGIEETRDLDLNQYDAFYRNADPQIGRWWQIDPKPNMAESPYSMMGNNPILNTDFLGDTLKIHHKKKDYIYQDGKLYNSDGTAYTGKARGFLKQSFKALNKIRSSDEGKKGITQLQNSENNFTVKYGERNHFEADNKNNAQAIQVINQLGIKVDESQPFNQIGSGGTIYFNPTSATINGTTFSPEIILTHEMGHAIDADKGLMDRSLIKIGGVCCEERTEARATYFQNIVSQQLGPKYPLRTYYGGTELPPMPPALVKDGQPVYIPPPVIRTFPIRLTPIY